SARLISSGLGEFPGWSIVGYVRGAAATCSPVDLDFGLAAANLTVTMIVACTNAPPYASASSDRPDVCQASLSSEGESTVIAVTCNCTAEPNFTGTVTIQLNTAPDAGCPASMAFRAYVNCE